MIPTETSEKLLPSTLTHFNIKPSPLELGHPSLESERSNYTNTAGKETGRTTSFERVRKDLDSKGSSGAH